MSLLVYVIEDDPEIARNIEDNLELEGYESRVFYHGADGEAACRQKPPDFLILDVGLPDRDGIRLLGNLRGGGLACPALMLTGNSEETTILKAFQAGADDYVTKPFSARVLLARIKAILNRHAPSSGKLFLGALVVDLERNLVKGPDAPSLTTREFQVLSLLAEHRGKPVSRMTLLEEVWGMESTSSERAVNTMMMELRKKVEPVPAHPRYVLSQRGVGYKLAPEVFGD